MIYFTADTHFCHGNIIGLCGRPFKDAEDMNMTLIRNWNAAVGKNDEIYIIGDFLYKGDGKKANEILSRLKGKKYLIRGNHEKYLEDRQFDVRAFEWVKDYFVLHYQGTKIVLFHYPIIEWDGYFKGSVHLYGHVHNGPERNPALYEGFKALGARAVNVGVEMHNYCPVSVNTIFEIIKRNENK